MIRLFLLVLLASCGVVRMRAERTLTISEEHVAKCPLVVRTENGGIHLTGDPHLNTVEIEATLVCGGDTQAEADTRVAHAAIQADRAADGTLTIQPRFPDGSQRGDGATIRVRLPDTKSIHAKTSNGTVKVVLLGGDLRIETSNGGVGVTDHGGPVRIDTSNGGILARRVAGPLHVRSSNGPIVAEGIRGAADLKTSNGSITLTLAPDQPGPVQLKTTNGAILATVGPAFAGTVTLKTSNGRLDIEDRAGRVVGKHLDKRTGTLELKDPGEASSAVSSNGAVKFVIAK